jgi:hypothetical protein
MKCKGYTENLWWFLVADLLDGNVSVGAIKSREILHWQDYLLLRQDPFCGVTVIWTQKTEAAGCCETSVKFYQTTRRRTQENSYSLGGCFCTPYLIFWL